MSVVSCQKGIHRTWFFRRSISLPFSSSKPEDRVFSTRGTKGFARRAYAPWTLDTGWKPMLQ